jgi:hypothetical protein
MSTGFRAMYLLKTGSRVIASLRISCISLVTVCLPISNTKDTTRDDGRACGVACLRRLYIRLFDVYN